MRTLSVVCVLLIAAFTTADITLPNIRPGQVISALQKDTYASSLGILSTDKETRARNRALQRRRPITRRPKWIPKLQHIPEEEEYVHMAEASPSRKAKRNVPSTTTFGTTGASIPQNTRKPLQRQRGSINLLKNRHPLRKTASQVNPKFFSIGTFAEF